MIRREDVVLVHDVCGGEERSIKSGMGNIM